MIQVLGGGVISQDFVLFDNTGTQGEGCTMVSCRLACLVRVAEAKYGTTVSE